MTTAEKIAALTAGARNAVAMLVRRQSDAATKDQRNVVAVIVQLQRERCERLAVL
jgi:hypothetical protein